MALTRVQVTTSITLTHTFEVDEALTDAAGAVTVTVKRLDGTQIAGSPFTANHISTGIYSFALPASPLVDLWTLDWAGNVAGANVSIREQVEHVGGFMFTIAQARNVSKTMKSTTAFTTADLMNLRTKVEMEAERCAGHAFVPRFARWAMDGNNQQMLALPDIWLRDPLRAVTINGTALTQDSIDAIVVKPSGVLWRPGGWPFGRQANCLFEYEHGMDAWPDDVSAMGLYRLQSYISLGKSAVPDRAISYSVAEGGGVYRLGLAGPRSTGIPDVDAAYHGYGYDGPV